MQTQFLATARRATQEAGPDVDVELDEVLVGVARNIPGRDPRRPIYGLGALGPLFQLHADPPRGDEADIPEGAGAAEGRGVALRRMQDELAALQRRVDERDAALEARFEAQLRERDQQMAAMAAELAELRAARAAGAPPPPDDAADLGQD